MFVKFIKLILLGKHVFYSHELILRPILYANKGATADDKQLKETDLGNLCFCDTILARP